MSGNGLKASRVDPRRVDPRPAVDRGAGLQLYTEYGIGNVTSVPRLGTFYIDVYQYKINNAP